MESEKSCACSNNDNDSPIIRISQKDYDKRKFEDTVLLKDYKLIIVDFNAKLCPPCKTLYNDLCNIAHENSKVHVYLIDYNESPKLFKEYSVITAPSVAVFKTIKVKSEEKTTTKLLLLDWVIGYNISKVHQLINEYLPDVKSPKKSKK